MPRRTSKRQLRHVEQSDEDDASAASLAGEDGNEELAESSEASSPSKSRGERSVASQGKKKDSNALATANPAKKRKGQYKAPATIDNDDQDKKKGVFSLELLLNFPPEVFAEICTFLTGGDLVELSRVCKPLRYILLGEQSKMIWEGWRRGRKLSLPPRMSEQQLADLVDGKECHFCHTTLAYTSASNYYLRYRICWPCEKTEVIKGSKIRNGMKGLHPLARQCVRFYDHGVSPFSGRQQPIEYLIKDLWAASNKLYELAEQDEVAKHALTASRSTKTTRSKRVKAVRADIPEADQVGKYVEEKKEVVAQDQAVAKQILDTIQAERDAARKVIEDAQKRKDDKVQAKLDNLRRTLRFAHGWSPQQLDWHSTRPGHLRVPNVSPDQDAEAWAIFRDFVQSQIDRDAAETAVRVARVARRDAIKPYYDDFKEDQPPRLSRLVPGFAIFAQWPAVKPLWEPVDANISDRIWAQNVSHVSGDFKTYCDEVHVEAIRAITRATTGDWRSTASTDPADYPEDEYNEGWFERPTALFFGELDVTNQPGYITLCPLPYPDTLLEHLIVAPGFGADHKTWLREHIDERQVGLVRLILAALEEDENSITSRELDEIGERFRWVNSPYKIKKERERHYTWVQLFYALKRRGPKIYDLRLGINLPEIALWPADGDEVDLEEDGDSE
ncbi:hypothetical protein JCM3770_006641 [Rhodotorula araucariae]